jgi:hypothetical protein
MSSDGKLRLFLRIRYFLFRLRYIGRLKFSDKVAYVQGKLGWRRQKLGGTRSRQEPEQQANPADVPEETKVDTLARERIRNIFAVNDQAFRAYIPRRYHGRVAIIRSVRGYHDPDKDYSPDPYLGWGRVLSGVVETYEVPGDHNAMIREPHVRLLAEHLRTSFDNALRQLNSANET